MPTSIDDKVLTDSLYLNRFDAEQRRQVEALLKRMRGDLLALLGDKYLPEATKRQIIALLKETGAVIDSYYKQAADQLDVNALVVHVTGTAQAAVQASIPISITAQLPTVAHMRSIVSGVMFNGSPLSDWWTKQSADTAFKFAGIVRQGILQGSDYGQLTGPVMELMDVSDRNAFGLVHTSIQAVANDARMAVFEANADVIRNLKWLATMDSHVCFSEETKVLMADGSEKNIGDIIVGDFVIGGVTGEPCKVQLAGKRMVESSVVIQFNDDSQFFGKVTYEHPVLTKSGWREIGSVSLSTDIHEREVLCRSFKLAEKTHERTHEILSFGSGIRATQCDQEIRTAGNEHIVREHSAEVCFVYGNKDDSRIEHQSAERIQHDGWGRGDSRKRPGEMDYRHNQKQQETKNSRGKAAPKRSDEKSMGRSCLSGKSELSERRKASGASCIESGMGVCESCEDVGLNEVKVERPGILGKNGAEDIIGRIKSDSASKETSNHKNSRKKSRTGGDDAPKMGEENAGRSRSHEKENQGNMGKQNSGANRSNATEETINLCKKENVSTRTISGKIDNNPVVVVTLSIENDHTFVAAGMIVHNCALCIGRSGKKWRIDKTPIGHSIPFQLPPIHVKDRCVMSAESNLTPTESQADFTRASSIGQIDAKTTFDQYLKRVPASQVEEMLGKGRYDLWKSGKMTTAQMLDQTGRELTLKELRAKYN